MEEAVMRSFGEAKGLILALVAVLAAAGSAAAGGAEERRIDVVGTGVVSAEPDYAELYLGVQTHRREAGAAVAAAREQMNSVVASLREMGIGESSMQTTAYRIHFRADPQREAAGGSEAGDQAEPRGRYVAENQLRVRVTRIAELGSIIDRAVRSGANRVQRVSFGSSEADAHQDRARRQAVNDAREKARTMAGELGLELGEVISISEDGGGRPGPTPEYAALQGRGGDTPISPGTLSFTARVQVAFGLR
jgi:hypothetical protein